MNRASMLEDLPPKEKKEKRYGDLSSFDSEESMAESKFPKNKVLSADDETARDSNRIKLDIKKTEEQLKIIRKSIDLPLAVGFGIKDAETAKILSNHADAIVIGSAIVNIIENEQADKNKANSDIMNLMSPIRVKLDENIISGDNV